MNPPRRLGKLPVKHDSRTAYLSDFLVRPKLPPAPPSFAWDTKLPDDVGMMRNDAIGDCTCAGAAHLVQVWTANNGGEVTISDDDVVAAYSAITGYTPDDPTTDAGAALLDVLRYWRTTGIGGHRIGAFVKLRHNDRDEVRVAGQMFGGLYTGAQLPVSAEGQVGSLWSVETGPDAELGSWGGHCMAVCAATPGDLTYITWGKRQRASWEWVSAYADEMYAIISIDWVTGAKPAPSGLDMTRLRSYLSAL